LKDEIDGMKMWTEFVANNDDLKRMKEYHRLRRVDPEVAPTTYEFKLVDRNGLVKDIVATVALVPGTKKSLGALLDITERKRSEEALRGSLKEKEFLLRELNHRVNNNLQLISNLMRLYRKRITDKTALVVFDESQNSIRSVALVHEKLYHAGSFYNINLREYISELAQHILEAYVASERQVKVSVNVENVKLDIERVISCGLIINELLSNSLKYAFPGKAGGEISISLSYLRTGVVELVYKDNGVGIPEELDVRSAPTLGMQLIFNLAEKQLDGTIELERGNGVTFKVVFKEIPSDLSKGV
jgi:two-component sensor histidine kinase